MTEQSLKEKTAKGLFWGGFSNGIQQLLNLLFGIILLRILDATDYGMIGMLAIFTAIANSIQESGFTAALANKQVFRHEDYNAVFWFSFLMGASLYLLLFFCAPLIADFYKTPQLVPLSRFLFLGFLISSCGTAHNAVLFKKLMVKEKAKATIIALLCSGTIGIVMAYNRMAFWGLAVQQITYISIANALLWHFSQWRPTFSFNFKPIREMLPFSSKLLITNVFHYINDNIFSVLLGRFYTSQDVGYYTQANKWTNMGFSLISNMINGVSQPVLVETSSDAMRQKNIFRKMLRFTAFVSFPSMFGLALIANEFIVIAVTVESFYVEYHCTEPGSTHNTSLYDLTRHTRHGRDLYGYQHRLAVDMALLRKQADTHYPVGGPERYHPVPTDFHSSHRRQPFLNTRLPQPLCVADTQDNNSREPLCIHHVDRQIGDFL